MMGNIRDSSSRTGSPAAVLCLISVLEFLIGLSDPSAVGDADPAAPLSSVNVTLRDLLQFQSSHGFPNEDRPDPPLEAPSGLLAPASSRLPTLHYSCHPCLCSLSTRNCPFSTTPNFPTVIAIHFRRLAVLAVGHLGHPGQPCRVFDTLRSNDHAVHKCDTHTPYFPLRLLMTNASGFEFDCQA